MEFSDAFKTTLMETAKTLHGSARRLLLARTVQALGPGGQRRAEEELGWNRQTIRKGLHELESGITCLDAFSCRGHLRAEERLPDLLKDLRDLVKAGTDLGSGSAFDHLMSSARGSCSGPSMRPFVSPSCSREDDRVQGSAWGSCSQPVD